MNQLANVSPISSGLGRGSLLGLMAACIMVPALFANPCRAQSAPADDSSTTSDPDDA